jgi:hypothetical protein
MSDVIFKPEDHTYWLGRHRLPSVTEILQPLTDFRFVREDVLQWKSDLGRAVHRAIELHLLDDLEYDSLGGEVAQYFAQFLEFQRDSNFRAIATELVVSHPLGYAGTLDAVGVINRKVAVIDWKTTTALSPTVGLQTAAYANAVDKTPGDIPSVEGRRYVLRLSTDNYKLHQIPTSKYAGDLLTFASLLRVHQWCAENSKTINLEIPENVG